MLAHIVYRTRGRYVLGNEALDLDSMLALEESGEKRGGPIVVPVWAYTHKAVLLKATDGGHPGYPFDCPWNAGRSGFAYCTREEGRAWLGARRLTKRGAAAIRARLIQDVADFADSL